MQKKRREKKEVEIEIDRERKKGSKIKQDREGIIMKVLNVSRSH